MQSHIPRRKVKFWGLTIAHALLVIADLLLTYMGTPDLSRETNPLVTKFGYGWTALILVNIIGIALITSMAYACFIKYKRVLLPCKGFKEYCSMLNYGRPDKFKWLLYKPQTTKAGWMNALYMYCFASMFLSVFARLTVVINWLSYHLLKWRYIGILWFWRYKIQAVVPIRLFLLVGIFAFFASLFYWLIKEYLVNKRNLANTKN